MKTIRKHLLSVKEKTLLYTFENLSGQWIEIPKGQWLGVIETKWDRLHILSTHGEGWIKSEDVANDHKESYNISILRDDNGILRYGVRSS